MPHPLFSGRGFAPPATGSRFPGQSVYSIHVPVLHRDAPPEGFDPPHSGDSIRLRYRFGINALPTSMSSGCRGRLPTRHPRDTLGASGVFPPVVYGDNLPIDGGNARQPSGIRFLERPEDRPKET